MNTIKMSDFKNLANKFGERIISIYIPTSKQSTDGYQTEKIHLKNELKKIGAELDLDIESTKKVLKPLHDLLDDYEFWKNNSKMLAIFLADGELETYRLPIELGSSTYFVGKRPFLLPMIPELSKDGIFYLLLLDLNKIKLYQGSRNNIEEIELDPEAVALSYTDEEEGDENKTHIHGHSGGDDGMMFHGHGGGSDEDKKVTIQNYFHRMTNMLEPILNENPLPLYVSGDDYLIPLFREASKYTHLQKGHLPNTRGLNEKELQKKAWELAESFFEKEWESRKEDFGLKLSRNLAISNDNKKLIKASLTGAVDTLWVNKNHQHLWGTFNEEEYSVNFGQSSDGDTHCLIDLAAVKVLQNGGKVYLEDPEKMPGNGLITGTLRYEIA